MKFSNNLKETTSTSRIYLKTKYTYICIFSSPISPIRFFARECVHVTSSSVNGRHVGDVDQRDLLRKHKSLCLRICCGDTKQSGEGTLHYIHACRRGKYFGLFQAERTQQPENTGGRTDEGENRVRTAHTHTYTNGRKLHAGFISARNEEARSHKPFRSRLYLYRERLAYRPLIHVALPYYSSLVRPVRSYTCESPWNIVGNNRIAVYYYETGAV